MYLKSLEIQGFKSFANRIVFQFHNGITGVVGPNGSGKSNVSDAIRWVLGEQSAKQLRGGSMQDVIFAGTQTRKMMSYAYVAITFDNADHALPVDFEEVTVARRLYRSGESEYLMNGVQCRMRDITELIMDTGIGQEGYSLIGQGQVERILNGRPEERRELFDEAAGIVKYKHRKASAVKKLEDEEKNLVRVSDILSELTRQIGPLKRQSETAKVYLEKREELKSLDANLFLLDAEKGNETLKNANERLTAAREELEETAAQLAKARAQYEELDEALGQLSQQITEKKDSAAQERLNRSQLESRVELGREQIQTLENNDEQLRVRADQIRRETQERRTQLEGVAERFETLSGEAGTIADENVTKSRSLDELNAQLTALGEAAAADQARVMALLEERTHLHSGREKALALLEQLGVRESELKARELTLRSEQAESSGAVEDISGKQSQAQEQEKELGAQSQALQEELEQVHKSFLDDQEKLTALQEEYHREASRLETLRAITERYEGYGGSIRRVMEQKGREKGILGVVADLIKTQKKYELAVETALGGSIQNIVTEDEETAKRMIAFLKENRFGRATFLPLSAMKHRSLFQTREALSEKGVIGLASELVETEERFKPLAENLLGRTVVTDTIDTAIALARRYRYTLRIVTLDGELLSPGGSMTGGAFKSSSNLLGRRREIEELEEKVKKKNERITKLSAQVEESHTRRNNLRTQIADLAGKIQKNRFGQSALRMQLQDAEGRRSQVEDSFEQLRLEREKIAAERAQLESQEKEGGQGLAASGEEEEKIHARMAEREAQQAELKKHADELGAELEALRMKIANGAQEEKFLRQNRERLEGEIAKLEEEAEGITGRLSDNEEIREQRRAEMEELAGEIAISREKEDGIRQETDALSAQQAQMEEKRRAFFGEREQLSEKNSLLDREIYRLEDQVRKGEEQRETRITYIWEEYGLTPAACRDLKRDDIGSVTALRKAIGELRKGIRELGTVNVNAIEEYREVAERHEFLSTQHEDLVKSKAALEKVIAELDEGMRERFREQFERIRVEFDQTFRDLFGGGKGTLEIAEDEDILEASIRVIAQPPGKKLQNMMQLSGGEKSLTAIALLFAIQNLKPSPFCLLDEIESALDENNVDRFAKYLHKLTNHTQFIVITHRRGSMAAADRLYGITMQEKGVSALVSVDLVENELT